jgi:hypothetical protein
MSNILFEDNRRFKNVKITAKNNDPIIKADRILGDKTERYLHPRLCKWFNCKFDIDTQGWRTLDMMDTANKIAVEIKTRRNRSDRYNETMVGENKYKKARKLMLKGWKVFLIIKFTDGIYFYRFPTKLENDVRIEDGVDWRRGFEDRKKHLYIPMIHFNKLTDYNSYIEYLEK